MTTTTLLTVVVPLLFLSLLGIASLARAFGYLKTEKEKELEERLRKIYEWAREFKPGVDLTPVLNAITSLSGLIVSIKDASDKVALLVTSQDYGLYTLSTNHEGLKKCFNEMQEKVASVEGLIKGKTTAGLMEQIYVQVREIKEIVARHDASVRYLEDVHPRAEFQKGERPAHWCAASTLESQLSMVAEKVDKVLKHRYEMDKGSLDNMKSIISLLANALSLLESLKADINKLYDYIEPDGGDVDVKKR